MNAEDEIDVVDQQERQNGIDAVNTRLFVHYYRRTVYAWKFYKLAIVRLPVKHLCLLLEWL